MWKGSSRPNLNSDTPAAKNSSLLVLATLSHHNTLCTYCVFSTVFHCILFSTVFLQCVAVHWLAGEKVFCRNINIAPSFELPEQIPHRTRWPQGRISGKYLWYFFQLEKSRWTRKMSLNLTIIFELENVVGVQNIFQLEQYCWARTIINPSAENTFELLKFLWAFFELDEHLWARHKDI